MHVDALYFIQGKPELRELILARVDSDFADILCDRICIHSDEGGRTEWTEADHLLKVKLLYLASLSDWTPLASPDAFHAVFGSEVKTEAFFDKWWIIERFTYEYHARDMAMEFAGEIRRMPTPANLRVAKYFRFYLDRCEQSSAPNDCFVKTSGESNPTEGPSSVS